jgi:hypothetical protein
VRWFARLTSFDRKVGLGVYLHRIRSGQFLLYHSIELGLVDFLDWFWRGHFEEVKATNNPECSSVKSMSSSGRGSGATVRCTPNY